MKNLLSPIVTVFLLSSAAAVFPICYVLAGPNLMDSGANIREALNGSDLLVSALSVNDVTQAEGNSGTTAFTFTVSLSAADVVPVTVSYATANGTATVSDGDYTAKSGTLTFVPGQSTATVTVQVSGDTKFENNETFTLNLSGATNATIADGIGVGTITNDDPTPTISINDVSQAEGNSGTTNFTFTASLSNTSSQTITVNFATADSTATVADNDYTAKSGTLTFSPGQSTSTVTVAVTGDTTFESNETFLVALSSPTNATVADPFGFGTIINDDVGLSVTDVSLAEGNAGTTNFIFTVSLSNTSASTITVNYATADGTATTADGDYTAKSGTLTFIAGQSTATVTVQVTGDTKFESNETFTLNLSGATNATIADGSGLGTINNDDAAPTLSITDVTQAEGNSGITVFIFTVSLSNPSGFPTTVNYSTVDGTATTADNDYIASSGSLTMLPGETSKTISILVIADTKFESNETFTLNLSGPTNATIADGTGLGTITNDDSTPTISINNISQAEGNSGTSAFTFTVSLSNSSAFTVTVNYATADGTATVADNDYTATSGSITFSPGVTSNTVTVLVNGDTKFENNETFTLNLSSPSNATIANGTGTATIINDDSTPTISINNISQAEGNSGTSAFTFTVSLSNASGSTITVNYSTADGTATVADSDYAATSGSLTFAPGVTSNTVTVLVNGDAKFESNETFTLNLSSPSNATLANGTGLGTITNDDLSPTAAPVSISGRVMTADGQGIGRVSVKVTGGDLTEPRYTSTSATGDYTVPGLTAGKTYIITVKVKNYTFAQQERVVNLMDDLTGFDFIANPQ